MTRKPRLFAGVALLAILATSCSDFRDAIVFNPCSIDAHVSFGSDHAADSSQGWHSATAIPRERAITLKDVLADVGEPYWARIEFDGVRPLVRSLPFPFPADDAPVLVLIPARLCP